MIVTRYRNVCCRAISFVLAIAFSALVVRGDAAQSDKTTNQVSKVSPSKPLAAALPPAKWQQVEGAVDRGLKWLASQQATDGSFPTPRAGQPAVSSLCVLAFLSRGHQPRLGPYGETLSRAIDFVLACQRPNGLFSYQAPGSAHVDKEAPHAAVYNHAIAGLMLGEVYGLVQEPTSTKARRGLEQALQFSRQ